MVCCFAKHAPQGSSHQEINMVPKNLFFFPEGYLKTKLKTQARHMSSRIILCKFG